MRLVESLEAVILICYCIVESVVLGVKVKNTVSLMSHLFALIDGIVMKVSLW